MSSDTRAVLQRSCLVNSTTLDGPLQTLLFDGKPMLDPLSLADCKGVTCGGQNLITVQVLVFPDLFAQQCECVLPLQMWAMQVSD